MTIRVDSMRAASEQPVLSCARVSSLRRSVYCAVVRVRSAFRLAPTDDCLKVNLQLKGGRDTPTRPTDSHPPASHRTARPAAHTYRREEGRHHERNRRGDSFVMPYFYYVLAVAVVVWLMLVMHVWKKKAATLVYGTTNLTQHTRRRGHAGGGSR